MKLNAKRAVAVYTAIHDSIMDLRFSLKLPAKQDVVLAQVEHVIWDGVKAALNSKE